MASPHTRATAAPSPPFVVSIWLVPILGVSGLLVYRAWQHDAALRSGELMDVRDVLPDGEVDIELGALGGRLYRLELQFEACVECPRDDDPSAEAMSEHTGELLYRLRVERPDGPILYERERPLQNLFGMASSAGEKTGIGSRRGVLSRHWGCVPLLEFQPESLGRLRFDFSIQPSGSRARLDKAQLVLKENVRRLRYPAALLDRIQIDSPDGAGPI